MPEIHVLDAKTIDLIAAGEVVERPSSVVKELVENALDAGATAITVEIKEGGIGFIRVTDNGYGMTKEQVRDAFLRHATSKIKDAGDLDHIQSLGFRGEALSSIAAVSQVELITKTGEDLTGVRLCLNGAVEQSFEEIGAPEGTTFLMRNLFYNTPVRKKFLKQAYTEGGYVTDLMEHLALSRPDVSFQFIIGNQPRFHTSGNGNLKEVIYRIYGREIANAVIPIQWEKDGMQVEGYLGKPTLVRSNRNYEIYFVNGRFIKSTIVARALEEGYKEYLMQHKFPLCVLHVTLDPGTVDVNVHPTKMDVRFSNQFLFTDFLVEGVMSTLHRQEMIPQDRLKEQTEIEREAQKELTFLSQKQEPEVFEKQRIIQHAVREDSAYRADQASSTHAAPLPKEDSFRKSPVWERVREAHPTVTPAESQQHQEEDFFVETHEGDLGDSSKKVVSKEAETLPKKDEGVSSLEHTIEQTNQLNLFEEKLLSEKNRDKYHIIGQVFDTYWLFEFEQKLCILDQHAAHEKIKYERFLKRYREKEALSQNLLPPIILSLNGQEESVLKEYWDTFIAMGFEMEAFGGNEYCLRSVPIDLYGCNEKEMFLEVLNELEQGLNRRSPRFVEEKIATMACKAAVKGNNRLSREEADRLIDELLTLDNPYNCPHGRPTIITISKYEMEKKFKRIV